MKAKYIQQLVHKSERGHVNLRIINLWHVSWCLFCPVPPVGLRIQMLSGITAILSTFSSKTVMYWLGYIALKFKLECDLDMRKVVVLNQILFSQYAFFSWFPREDSEISFAQAKPTAQAKGRLERKLQVAGKGVVNIFSFSASYTLGTPFDFLLWCFIESCFVKSIDLFRERAYPF